MDFNNLQIIGLAFISGITAAESLQEIKKEEETPEITIKEVDTDTFFRFIKKMEEDNK